MDNMVKVDPKLFITCRLCLEDMGMYQITPVVQEQIKFCFDIDVNQFDGLPQLLCAKCEGILSEYFTKKRIFIGRQNALIAKLQVRKEIEDSLCLSPPHEAVSSGQQNDIESTSLSRTDLKRNSRPKKRKSCVISSSSSSGKSREVSASPVVDNECVNDEYKKTNDKKRTKSRRESWETNYIRKFGCKFCHKYIKGGGIGNHIKSHANLLSKYQDIIKRSCIVQLNKIDDKPNATGNSNTVVLSQDRIIGQQKENVYILYLSKECGNSTENAEVAKSEVTYINSDDEEEHIGKVKSVKRRRLLSSSSTDTVILNEEDKNCKKIASESVNTKNAVIECINIDDSSNGSHESDCKSIKNKDSVPIKPKDAEAIKNLIKVCHNKYLSKQQNLLDMDIKKSIKDPQLKHKLLSIGRKVLTRQGFSCTGLLRFIENKDLSVKWIPANKETNYVHIMARLKSSDELALDSLGWVKRSEVTDQEQIEILPKTSLFKILSSDEIISDSKKIPFESNKICADKNEAQAMLSLKSTNISTVSCENNSNNVNNAESNDMLFQDTKLLNASPAPFPKQLPKKHNVTELKPINQAPAEKAVLQLNTGNQEGICDNQDNEQSNYVDMCMPVITSTKSLAGSSLDNIENNAISENNDEIEKPVPRIKVKPYSELMSERVLKNLSQKQPGNMWVSNTSAAAVLNSLDTINITRVTSGDGPAQAVPIVATSNSQGLVTFQRDRNYIILDTVELPNTKTDSVIKYLRNLLQIHNIVLLDSHESMPSNAICLVKFIFQLTDNAVTVKLSQSVHCASNAFVLSVRDPDHMLNYIDLQALAATWQWEILKSYTTSQVTNRMLQTAQKESQEMYEYTKKFLCILKAINKKDNVC